MKISLLCLEKFVSLHTLDSRYVFGGNSGTGDVDSIGGGGGACDIAEGVNGGIGGGGGGGGAGCDIADGVDGGEVVLVLQNSPGDVGEFGTGGSGGGMPPCENRLGGNGSMVELRRTIVPPFVLLLLVVPPERIISELTR